jgi:hypothetical protein
MDMCKNHKPYENFMFKEDVATTICMLKMVMPPSFFDVMTHTSRNQPKCNHFIYD